MVPEVGGLYNHQSKTKSIAYTYAVSAPSSLVWPDIELII